MRLQTRRDRDRLGRAGGLFLVLTLAIGSPTLGDGPDKDKDGASLIRFDAGQIEGTFGWVKRALGQIATLSDRPLSPWLYEPVVLKSSRTELLVDGKPVPRPDGRFFHKFTVKNVYEDEKGVRLWVFDGPLKGWVRATEVIGEEKAGAYFTDLIGREPASAEAYYLRGALDKDREASWDRALADLTEAVRLDPRFTEALVDRGGLYFEMKNHDRAIADFTEAIRINPGLSIAYHERARVCYEKKDVARALADLTEAIRIDPGDPMNHATRGFVHHNNKTWDKALVDLTEAIRLSPPGDDDLEDVYLGRGEAHRNLKHYDQAIADYTEAIRLVEPRTFLRDEMILFIAVYQRADAWDSKKDHDRAIDGFTEAIGRADKREYAAMGYAGRAGARKHRKDIDGALADYAEALRHDPVPVVAAVSYMNRGSVASDRNDLESALAEMTNAIQALPDHPIPHVRRAQVLTEHGHHDRALADCDRAVEVDPKNPWGYYYRAWINATCPDAKYRDGKKAVEGATHACELTDWKNPYGLETLAAAEAESGDFDSAVKWQTRASELATDEDDETRARFRDRLELFRDKKPYRDVPRADGGRRAGRDLPEIPLTSR